MKQLGSDHAYILRIIRKSLDKNLLQIIQNSEVSDKIAELMKSRQTKDNPLASDTTKKALSNSLDPDKIDLSSVLLDFANEV